MGLISRVSSRTYRKQHLIFPKKPCLTIKKTTRWPPPQLRRATFESPSLPRTPRLSTRLALKLAAEQRLSTSVARTPRSRSRDHDLCQPDECGLPRERRRAVRVPRLGTDS